MTNPSGSNFIGSVVEEGKKVVWPNRELVIRHTVMVVVSIVLAVLLFAAVDYGLAKLVLLAIK